MLPEIKKDVIIYYIFSFLLGFYIANGTTVLFIRELNFTYSQVFNIAAIYMLMFMLFEVPSGAFADLVGRKRSVAIGCLVLTIAAIVTGISNTYPQVLASFLLWALGFSCISGATEALLYDRINDEATYGKVLGKSMLFGLSGTIFAGIIGPYLFNIYFRYPYFFSAIPFFLAGIAILFFYEAKNTNTYSLRNHLLQMKGAARTAFSNKFIRWATFVLALVFAINYTMSNAYQPYLTSIGFTVTAFSIILPIMFLSEGFGGFSSSRIFSRIGETKSFLSVLIFLGLSIGLLGLYPNKISLSLLFFYTFIQGVGRPLLSIYSNRYISSHERATVVSVQSMFATIAAALPLFLFGFLTDKFGLHNLYIILGILILVLGGLLLVVKPKNITTQ
jgi:MFS family permease